MSRPLTARPWIRCCAVLALFCSNVGRANTLEPVAPSVTVTEGRLQGVKNGPNGAIFRGVPYARAPVDSLRWKPPQPPSPWSETRAASEAAPPCLQAFVGWNWPDAQRSAEDCLYLDIHTPQLDRRARLPVLVWLHGGGNWAGSGGWVVNSSLADRGIVVVAVQYRLGVFGFLSHPDLSRESPHAASGNYGLMDQIAALRWVKKNIEAFGGDPDSITVAGHSAGAQDVGLLMLSPQARGLFARAIQQSGTAGFGLPARSLAENEQIGVALADLAGVPRRSETESNDSTGVQLAVLRSIPGRKLLDAQLLLEAPGLDDHSLLFVQPVVDGWVVPSAPVQLLAEGKSAPVPLLIGNASQEVALNGGE